ncbi:HEAT repeat domain-containing protein [Sporosarcina sp. ITBMC105]
MIGLPIEWIILLIVAMSCVLVVFIFYLSIVSYRDSNRKELSANYLTVNRERWYEYLREDDICDDQLIPKNVAEITAIEELFRSVANNLKGKDLDRRISRFANRRLAEFYKQKLKSRNWGERINALNRIYDFNIYSLDQECRSRLTNKVSSEELFLLLVIELKFASEKFLDNHQQRLQRLTTNDLKELFYSMPEEVFNEILSLKEHLHPNVRYALADVIGMKMDRLHTQALEDLYKSEDDELRIRVIRAFNTLAAVPEIGILAKAITSKQWQERYQVAQMLRNMPKDQANQYVKQLINDNVFLVRESAQSFLGNKTSFQQPNLDIYKQVAASVVESESLSHVNTQTRINDQSDGSMSSHWKGGD